MDLAAIQAALRDDGLDGWLFCDFRGSDPIGAAILGLGPAFRSRRWFYFVPARGEPVRVVHAIESETLDALPGRKLVYLPWKQLHEHLRGALAGAKRVAMQYSPLNNIPYVAKVDAGTIELIRSFGVEPATSAGLVQRFEATIDEAGYQGHERAARHLGRIVHEAFKAVAAAHRGGRNPTECEIQDFISAQFEAAGMEADHPAIVGANAHSADPHFAPDRARDTPIRPGDWLLIDLWAKEKKPGAIYADITWTGFCGREAPAKIRQVFGIVRDARDAAVRCAQEGLAAGRTVRGCDVDDACRAVIEKAGFGERFIHRTGHSIHTSTHGNGTHIDNLETHDDRPLLARTCFSVEPGIYLPGEFGIRSEINVFVADARTAVVTGIPAQTEIVAIV